MKTIRHPHLNPESINRYHTKVKNYVASVTNPTGALKRLLGISDIRDAAEV